MSKFPLDLSKFKKHSSDTKSTTLQHDDGHKLTIIHSSLDKKNLAALNGLPALDQENKVPVQKFAEGDEVLPNPRPNASPDETPTQPTDADYADVVMPQNNKEPKKPMSDSEYSSMVDDAVSKSAPKETNSEWTGSVGHQETPSNPSSQPTSAPAGTIPATPDKLQKLINDRDSILKEDAAIAHDGAAGHIKPENMQQLFAGKDPLAKVGTLFGLLVGGAGAGLTHTENPVLAAMKQEISNNIEAQKANVSNQQTLLGLNRGRFSDTESQINLTRMQMNRIAAQKIANQVNTMAPNDPRKPAAMQQLAAIGQFVDTSNMDLATQIAAKQAFLGSLQDNGGGGDAAYQAQQNAFRLSGNPAYEKFAATRDDRTIPGIPGHASIPIPQEKRDELQAMNVLDNKAADLLAYAKAHKGSLDPNVLATGAQKAHEMTTFYNSSLDHGIMTGGRLDWLDKQIKKNPTSIFQDILGNNARLQEIQNSNAQRRQILLKGLGYSGNSVTGTAPQAEVQMKNGVQYQKVNGGWKRVQ